MASGRVRAHDRKGTGEALSSLSKTHALACWISMHREALGMAMMPQRGVHRMPC